MLASESSPHAMSTHNAMANLPRMGPTRMLEG